MDVVNLDLDEAWSTFYDFNRSQIASVVLSLFTLAWSYTAQYRQNKENSVALIPNSMFYFASVAMLVIARIVSFEMFAYYLGPGFLGDTSENIVSMFATGSSQNFRAAFLPGKKVCMR